jgi:hypothetical protein
MCYFSLQIYNNVYTIKTIVPSEKEMYIYDSIGIRQGVSNRVEDNRRLAALWVSHLWQGVEL